MKGKPRQWRLRDLSRSVILPILLVFCLFLPGCSLFVETLPDDWTPALQPEDRFIRVGSVRHHYREYGSRGPDVLLLHGFASSTYTWDEVAPLLRDQGFHVWSLDMKGFGWSDRPVDGFYDPVTLAGEVRAWMDAVGLRRAALVGNSLGGGVSWLLALEHPERVDRLVLVDAAAYEIKKPLVIRLGSLPYADEIMKLFFSRTTVRWGLESVLYRRDRVTDGRIDAYYDRLRTGNALAAQVAVARALDYGNYAVYVQRIPEIRVPTLILWGQEDGWIPVTVAHRFRQDLPQAELVILPACGHVPQEEDPGRTAQLIARFLKGETGLR